ncbi:hypothetical protein OH77DRAFT_1586857 [Trametes cingulata]|nr:hypothetical protein OH77DRAFT_1586857 [Trametes cingulata]
MDTPPGPRSRPTARQSVLRCPELLENIFESFSATTGDLAAAAGYEYIGNAVQENRGDLAACAQVCRDFCEPALNILWRYLEDFEPLLCLFEEFRMFGEDPGTGYLFIRDISPSWPTFQRYAAKVRELQYPSGIGAQTGIWIMLAQQCRGEPLLPNLRRLDALGVLHVDIPPLLLLLSPALRHVRIQFDKERFEDPTYHKFWTANLFRSIAAKTAPSLTELEISGNFPLVSTYFRDLDCCQRLQILRISPIRAHVTISVAAISTLSCLQNLRSLYLPTDFSKSDTDAWFHKEPPFTSLEILVLTGSARDIVRFLSEARPPVLRLLRLSIKPEIDPETIYHHLSQIRNYLPSQLEKLIVGLEAPSLDTPVPAFEVCRILCPFLSFANISDVKLSFGNGACRLTDEDVVQIARAWPNLVTVHISPTPGSHEDPPNSDRPTVRALVELARHCPSLRSVTLPGLDISGPRLPSADSVPVLQTPLSCLKVCSLVGEAESDAKFAILLDRLFPNLKDCGSWAVASTSSERVRRIETIVKAMQLAREHGRLRGERPPVHQPTTQTAQAV